MISSESLATTAALTAAAALMSESRTAIQDHRMWTHRSLAFKSDRVEQGYRLSGAHLTDTKRWACVHRVHHADPDANFEGFVELADYVDFLNDSMANNAGHPDIPDEVYGLDPAVESIDFNVAYEIGSLKRDQIGGLYQPRREYSPLKGTHILYSKTPRFFYEDAKEMKKDRKNPVKFDPDNPPSLHQMRFLLRDPHSPALHRRGIPGVIFNNVPLYGYLENNFEDPIFRPADLQPDSLDEWTRKHRPKLRLAYVAGMMATNVLLGRSKERAAGNAVLGATASGLAVVALIAGGALTNGLGHGGDLKKLTWSEFWDGKVYPKPDGTYTSNSKPLGPPTLDEVGGQEVHHDHPDYIAYTEAQGIQAVEEAPFGMFLQFLVDHNILFKRGDNFDGQPRPDLPSEAVLQLQAHRAKKLAQLAIAA